MYLGLSLLLSVNVSCPRFMREEVEEWGWVKRRVGGGMPKKSGGMRGRQEATTSRKPAF
jgi:hypothetical protein